MKEPELRRLPPGTYAVASPIPQFCVQLVPIDGTATWQWKAKPKEAAKDQKLTIRALLVYPNDPNKAGVEITSYTAGGLGTGGKPVGVVQVPLL